VLLFEQIAPNARYELLLEAGARHERTLEAVGCMPLILMEAPSSADHDGLLAWAQQRKQPQEEETP
jgi:hypothetical protein